ncbi:MAG: hypothetical protein Q8862_00260 [Bacteroidota bacterium]|nr:hypothetical protein [Bacteroidota bacterium]MDP4205242.1 hypothetical protein [Bacteroidota bacterium]
MKKYIVMVFALVCILQMNAVYGQKSPIGGLYKYDCQLIRLLNSRDYTWSLEASFDPLFFKAIEINKVSLNDGAFKKILEPAYPTDKQIVYTAPKDTLGWFNLEVYYIHNGTNYYYNICPAYNHDLIFSRKILTETATHLRVAYSTKHNTIQGHKYDVILDFVWKKKD